MEKSPLHETIEVMQQQGQGLWALDILPPKAITPEHMIEKFGMARAWALVQALAKAVVEMNEPPPAEGTECLLCRVEFDRATHEPPVGAWVALTPAQVEEPEGVIVTVVCPACTQRPRAELLAAILAALHAGLGMDVGRVLPDVGQPGPSKH